MDNGDGFILSALVEEELGRLEEVEDEEANHKHGERDDAYCQDEIPPSLLRRPLPNEEPRNERRRKLSDRPPDRQQGEQSARRIRQKLEKQGTVNGQVSTDAETERAEEEADAAPALGVRGHDAEDAGDEERHVEGDAAAEKVGPNAPDETAEGETEE